VLRSRPPRAQSVTSASRAAYAGWRSLRERLGPVARRHRWVSVQAKLCQSNRAGGLTEIEEAWVVRAPDASLNRSDGGVPLS